MAIRLDYFQYLPRDVDGWGTYKLRFGSMLTAVQAPNGVGKTPVMKGIVSALGHEVQLPPEIVQHCLYAEVGISIEGRQIILTRTLGDDFELRVRDGATVYDFDRQASFGDWLVKQISDSTPSLTSKGDAEVGFYATTLLPAFWVDQDHGWTRDYWVPANRNFIRDQRQEVIRFVVGLPPRHPFRSKVEFESAKTRLERTEKSIELQRFLVERISQDLNYTQLEEDQLTRRRLSLKDELDANQSAIEAIRSSSQSFDGQISDLQVRRLSLDRERNDLVRRRVSIDQVVAELSGEEDILEANSTATDLMRQICGRDGCQMFQGAERSFGRSLLFLKDQIKDLRFTAQEANSLIETVDSRIREIDAALSDARERRDAAVSQSSNQAVVNKLEVLTGALVDVSMRLARFQQYKDEQGKFEVLIDRREQEAVAVNEARQSGGRRASTNDVRSLLSDSLQSWLIALGTKNTRDVHFDDEFSLHVNGERFTEISHQSGSTRTRIILAFHAALLEVSLQRGGNHPGWLLLDAPKQHELKQEDFDRFMERLQVLAATYEDRVQIVFSAADVKTQLLVGDELWTPQFTVDDEPRFLGVV